nr:MAG TPA: hypothetical protein [Caudoviricetes sp.]
MAIQPPASTLCSPVATISAFTVSLSSSNSRLRASMSFCTLRIRWRVRAISTFVILIHSLSFD